MFKGGKKGPNPVIRRSQETMTWKRTGATSRHSELRESLYKSKASLSAENMYLAVILPDQKPYYLEDDVEDMEQINEWLAENTIDFYNEITVMMGVLTDNNEAWEKVCDEAAVDPNLGYPKNVTYRWKSQESVPAKVLPVDVYMDHVMIWVNSQLESEYNFPTDEDVAFPTNFRAILSKIMQRMFRILSIFFSNECLYNRGGTDNTQLHLFFRHFIYFGLKWKLLKANDLKVIDKFTAPMVQKFRRDHEMYCHHKLPLH